MIEWLVYLLTGAFAGFVLAFGIALFKVGPGKPEFAFGKALLACLAVAWVGPFGYVEVMTKLHEQALEPVVKDYFTSDDCPIQGTMKYFKVLYATNNTAVVYLVSNEPQDWGGNDSPLVKLKLKHSPTAANAKMGGWEVTSTKLLRSDRLQKDSVVWPPYQ
ncbi:MAG: hypothetical protein JST12_06900 [Armatimonadetes bacterium]|nr:hypothetical protein [Armatimonadota bacterium]MBS1701369.1 hypothetical protein [Armatimonadota bacterium]MBS1728385.1 hypothetical protein [Armatimonadota bacterium]